MSGVLVLAELSGGGIQSSSLELLAAARKLADVLGEDVGAAVPGADPGGVADAAIAHGADKVCVVDDPLLSEPQIDAHLAAYEHVCRELSPSVVLIGRTPHRPRRRAASGLPAGRRRGAGLRGR